MKIVLRDLPGDVTAERLSSYMEHFGGARLLELTTAGNASRATAELEMDVSSAVAETVCNRIHQTPFEGHTIRAELLLFFK